MTKSFDVYLSYASQDKPAVRKIAKALVDTGLNVWFDEWNIVPGEPWQSAIADAITNSKSALIFVGESGIGPWQRLETSAALRAYPKSRFCGKMVA